MAKFLLIFLFLINFIAFCHNETAQTESEVQSIKNEEIEKPNECHNPNCKCNPCKCKDCKCG